MNQNNDESSGNETQAKVCLVKEEPYLFAGHQVRCVIVQPSQQLADIISNAAQRAGLNIVGTCLEANDAIFTLMYKKPDVALIHGMFPKFDCHTIIERLDSIIMTKYPAIIFNLPTMAAKVYGMTERSFLSPYDPRDLRRLLSESLPLPARQDIIERAKALLKRMGIPDRPALSYLAHASALVFNNALDMRRMSKYICPTIAAAHNTNSKAVAEAMRRAIDTAWTKGDIDRQYDYFKNTINPEKGKPTCVELIAMTAEILRCGEDWR